MAFRLYTASSANSIKRDSTTRIQNNTWTLVTATYNGNESINGIELYINGVKESSYKDTITGTYIKIF